MNNIVSSIVNFFKTIIYGREIAPIYEESPIEKDAIIKKKVVKEPPLKVVEKIEPLMYRNKAILLYASKFIGVVEWAEGSNPIIEDMLDHGFSVKNNDSGLQDHTPWCAGFIAYILETNPFIKMSSVNLLLARKYENWGVPIDEPVPGDLITRYRRGINSGFGHVGIFLGFTDYNKTHYYCLGGNQSDQVNVTIYSMTRGNNSGHSQFRRSSKHIPINVEMIEELQTIARNIRLGNNINLDQKVA